MPTAQSGSAISRSSGTVEFTLMGVMADGNPQCVAPTTIARMGNPATGLFLTDLKAPIKGADGSTAMSAVSQVEAHCDSNGIRATMQIFLAGQGFTGEVRYSTTQPTDVVLAPAESIGEWQRRIVCDDWATIAQLLERVQATYPSYKRIAVPRAAVEVPTTSRVAAQSDNKASVPAYCPRGKDIAYSALFMLDLDLAQARSLGGRCANAAVVLTASGREVAREQWKAGDEFAHSGYPASKSAGEYRVACESAPHFNALPAESDARPRLSDRSSPASVP